MKTKREAAIPYSPKRMISTIFSDFLRAIHKKHVSIAY